MPLISKRILGEGEQLVPRSDHSRISPEVLAAHRAAGMALFASALAFALVVTVAFRRHGLGGAVTSEVPHRSDDVGLLDAHDIGGALQDLVDNLEKVESIHPAAHRVKVPGAALYLERSPIAKKYRDLPVGSTVFPVKSQGGWVEVVVPEQEGQPPAMGWAQAPHGVDALLDIVPRPSTGGAHRASTATPQDLQRKWELARSRNGDLKGKIADFQDTMQKSSYRDRAEMSGVEDRRQAAAQAIAGKVKSGVSKLRHEVKKELRSGSAKQILSDLGKAFT